MASEKNVDLNSKESWALFKSLVAILLIGLCLWGGQWQYQRGVDRHERNTIVKERITKSAVSLDEISDLSNDPQTFEWRLVRSSGTFDQSEQILLRNRYYEGKYGFQVLTLFRTTTGEKFWVDRGWVQAGATALTKPTITPLPSGQVEIEGRIRLDSSLPQGAFFAISSGSQEIISKLNAQSRLETENYYIDLISGSIPQLTPAAPAKLPELSDGPHMAYALQWVFFAGLAGYGRILIRRSR
jgi:cytochrome oxidase assembly protein ShyY1